MPRTMGGLWNLPCWNALSEAQQTRLMDVGNLPLGYFPEGTACQRVAEVGVETLWDAKPGAPRFYCLDCAIAFLMAAAPPAPMVTDEHRHQWWTSGGAWRCDCGATEPRIVGPGV